MCYWSKYNMCYWSKNNDTNGLYCNKQYVLLDTKQSVNLKVFSICNGKNCCLKSTQQWLWHRYWDYYLSNINIV